MMRNGSEVQTSVPLGMLLFAHSVLQETVTPTAVCGYVRVPGCSPSWHAQQHQTRAHQAACSRHMGRTCVRPTQITLAVDAREPVATGKEVSIFIRWVHYEV